MEKTKKEKQQKTKSKIDKKRVISGAIMFLVALIVILLGNQHLFNITVAAIAALAITEYYHAVGKICKPIKWVGYLFCIFIALVGTIPNKFEHMIILMIIPITLLLYYMQAIVTNLKYTFKDIVYSFFGTIYVIYLFFFFTNIYRLENGKYLLWYAIIPASGSDIFGYIFGKYFGKHKLTVVSPKKSVEGSIAGIVGATLLSIGYTIVLKNVCGFSINLIYVIIMTVILSIIGQIGDLAASTIKRYVNIKDYSEIIPGHGGILDRFDSLLFIAPFAFVFLSFLRI